MPEECHSDPAARAGMVVGGPLVLCPHFALCSLIITFWGLAALWKRRWTALRISVVLNLPDHGKILGSMAGGRICRVIFGGRPGRYRHKPRLAHPSGHGGGRKGVRKAAIA